MKNYKAKTFTEEVVNNIVCDVCKKKFTVGKDDLEIQEMINIETRCGYGSIFEDDAYLFLDICQHCLKKKLGKYLRFY